MSKTTLDVTMEATSEASIRNDALHLDESNGCLYFLTAINACNTMARHCPGSDGVTLLTGGLERDRVRAGFAIDDASYYWTTRQGIRRLPKPPLPDPGER